MLKGENAEKETWGIFCYFLSARNVFAIVAPIPEIIKEKADKISQING